VRCAPAIRRYGTGAITPARGGAQIAARGLSNREIGKRLFITPKTAGNHIANIYTKIGVSNRAGASLYAMQHGLLPEETYVDV
jgi:hypothetical protein